MSDILMGMTLNDLAVGFLGVLALTVVAGYYVSEVTGFTKSANVEATEETKKEETE